MPTPTTTYSLSKPTIGGDDNAWGTEINNNLDKLDDLLDGTIAIAPNLVGAKIGGVAVTATAAELNILDGVTATAAELNILDGVTASTAEINLLDGVTATTTELNYVDGVTSPIQTQIDGKQAADATLTSLSGLSLAAGDVLYATAADTVQRLSIGTAGQVLTVNSGATAPEWAAGVTTSAVLAATAGASVGAVGTYAMCTPDSLSSSAAPGTTTAGSNLEYSSVSASGTLDGPSPSGTWRLMGYGDRNSVWMRIS
jgi:hypothetical protein